MDKQPVGQLPDLTQSNNDDEIMVITNDEYNQLKKEKISDFITDLTSTDENNAIVKGTDGKLFTKDFGNASNITEGTLPVSVLPDIPKDKLPEIETDDLPDSGITAGTYTYPTDIVVNSKGQVTSITEGQAGANNANQDLSNLGPLGLDKINQSKALETGAVSSDADVYADVQKYAHSTFDKSKFEVVGSPTITDDGIASGFSDTNYVQKSLDLSSIKTSIKINASFIFDTSRNEGTIWNKDLNFDFRVSSSGNVILRTFNGSSAQNFTLSNAQTGLKTGDNVDSSVIVTENQAIIIINGKTYTKSMTTDLSNIATSSVIMKFGKANIQELYYPNSIDLKSIAIWADGIPVSNGNKTGLYVAKPDNYEVVGSPTITEDGIASGFSDGNYLKMPNLPIIENNITMTCNVNIGVIGTVAFNYIMGWYTNESSSYLRFMYQNGKINIQWKDKDLTSGQAESNNVDSNSEHLLKFELTESNLKCYLDNVLFANVDVEINLDALTPDVFTIGRMNNVGGWILNQGSIDLNSFKVYVDGSLVYQPCLKIPYTEADSTSRIVDVAYRDRVQDLYEQTGEALFYTIDEQNQNFTLPAGDIYGMITKNREILDIVYPIGRPMPEENNVLLDNEVWLEGATVNIVDYPKLFKVYGTKYGGDGTTTFKLPDMRGRVLWGSSDGSNGYIESKLPNIKGNVHLEGDGGSRAKQTSTASGAFNWINPGRGASFENTGGGQPWFSDFNFDASRSNSIYSDSAKIVQPPAFKVRWKTRFE